MATSQSFVQRGYAKIESTYGTVPTFAGSDAFQFTNLVLANQIANLQGTDKSGTIVATVGSQGNRGGSFEANWEARPSGTAGTAPDHSPFYECTLGTTTVNAGTSVVYSLGNTIKSMSIASYREPSTMRQQISHGSVVNSLAFDFARDGACRFRASGTSRWVVDNVIFASLDSTAKGGLGSFPAEPGTPTVAGSTLGTFNGTASINGSTAFCITAASIRVETGVQVDRDCMFQGAYGGSPGRREGLRVFLDLTVLDEDAAHVVGGSGIYAKAFDYTGVAISLEVGTTAGSRIKWDLANCRIPEPTPDDSGDKWRLTFNGIQAYNTNASSNDAATLTFR